MNASHEIRVYYFNSSKDKKIGKFVRMLPDGNIVKTHWIFAHKISAKGKIMSYKARLVAKEIFSNPGHRFLQSNFISCTACNNKILYLIGS